MPEKRCSKCQSIKDSELFPKDRSKRDGLDLWCRACRALWRKANQTGEKKRRARHTIKWNSLSEKQMGIARAASRKYCHAWHIPMHEEDMYQEMLLAMAKRGVNDMHSLAVDYVRALWGVARNQNRINLEHGSVIEPTEENMASPAETSGFLSHCLALIREHFWKKDKSCKTPVIFELVYVWGLDPIEVSRMMNLNNSRISQITTECVDLLKKKLAAEEWL